MPILKLVLQTARTIAHTPGQKHVQQTITCVPFLTWFSACCVLLCSEDPTGKMETERFRCAFYPSFSLMFLVRWGLCWSSKYTGGLCACEAFRLVVSLAVEEKIFAALVIQESDINFKPPRGKGKEEAKSLACADFLKDFAFICPV